MGKFRPGKAESRQYKRGTALYRDETFHMELQDIIYEEFITRPESRQNRTEIHRDHVITKFALNTIMTIRCQCCL